MQNKMEEIMGRVLWEAVQELRQSDDPEREALATVAADDMQELAGLVCTASAIRAALLDDAIPEERRDRVRQRILAEISAERAARTGASGWARFWRSWRNPLQLPRWQGALAATALAASLVFVGLRGGDPRISSAVQPTPHTQVATKMAALANHDLAAEEERSVWAHLVHCDSCFTEYLKMLRERQMTQVGSAAGTLVGYGGVVDGVSWQ